MDFIGTDEDVRDAVDDGTAFGCPECHEVSEGSFCIDCHAGLCEGCSRPVLHGEVGDRVVDDPQLLWCKPCAIKVALAEQANEIAKLSRYGGGAPFLAETSKREDVIRWLQWCDPNGCHTDELAKAEDCDPYTAETAWDALAGMIIEASL